LKSGLTYLKTHLSVVSIILICLTITEVHLNLIRHKQRNVITWDVVGYYSYLPATFIDKDLKLSFITPENRMTYYGSKYGYVDDPQGHHVFKYSMGMTILYLPFFAAAHLLAEPLGYTADGYSQIYQLFIEYSGLFYLLFGLIFLRRLLLLYYSERVTALSIFVIFFGTNLLCYATIDAAMSHAYTFSLFSVLLYYTVHYYKSPKNRYVVFMAILLGLIVLVRPPNLLFGLAIVLVGVNKLSDLKPRFLFLLSHYRQAFLLVLVTALVILPQLLYWHYVTGHYLISSYGEEGFFFNKPHLMESLIGFRKGWLVYSPVFFFALTGLWLLRKQAARDFLFISLLLLVLCLYLISAWWCWWYGGSFGLRPMIDLYPLLCIPLAACIFKIRQLKKTLRYTCFALLFCFTGLNIYQLFQYKYNIIHYDAMTFESYVNVLGKMDRHDIDTTLLDHPDYAKALKGLGD
jgi:hypothetical protein